MHLCLFLALFLYSVILYTWGHQYLPAENAKYGIYCDSLALSIGLQHGDMVLSLDNKKVDDFNMIVHDMIVKSSEAKGYRLSRAGILADHVHLVLGCPIEAAPEEVALGFINNLAYVHGMKPIYQYGGFVGTVGEYTMKAM